MKIKAIVFTLAFMFFMGSVVSAVFTLALMFFTGNAIPAEPTEEMKKQALDRFNGVLQGLLVVPGRVPIAEDVLYVEFMPVLVGGDGTPFVDVAGEVVILLPNRPVLRALRYHRVWTASLSYISHEQAAREAAEACIAFERALMEWRWGGDHAKLDPAFTQFIRRFEAYFVPLEEKLVVKRRMKIPIVRVEYLFSFFDTKRMLAINVGVQPFIFSRSGSLLPLDATMSWTGRYPFSVWRHSEALAAHVAKQVAKEIASSFE